MLFSLALNSNFTWNKLALLVGTNALVSVPWTCWSALRSPGGRGLAPAGVENDRPSAERRPRRARVWLRCPCCTTIRHIHRDHESASHMVFPSLLEIHQTEVCNNAHWDDLTVIHFMVVNELRRFRAKTFVEGANAVQG